MAFAIGWFTTILGLVWFVNSAVRRVPLSRSARPLSWELLPVRYVPLCVAGLLALVLSVP